MASAKPKRPVLTKLSIPTSLDEDEAELPVNDLSPTVFSSITDIVSRTPILTTDEVDVLVKKQNNIESDICNPEWKVKTGFTVNDSGNPVSCSVVFVPFEGKFRKIYKYNCDVAKFVTDKLYAEIFFQQKAFGLIVPNETSSVKNVKVPEIYKYGKLTLPKDKSTKGECYFYIDMENVPYETLYQIKKDPSFSRCNEVDDIVDTADKLFKANSIIHNDLKSDNILVNVGTEPLTVYIIDFGEATKTNVGRAGTGASTPVSVCGGKSRNVSKANKINRRKMTKKNKNRTRRHTRKSIKKH
jgi:hypothetical protein